MAECSVAHWFAALIDPRPGEAVLEIGCGRGELAAVLCGALGEGSYVGIDRSRIAIGAALRRDIGGRGSFVALALSEARALDRRFDKIVALNVNVFWQRADVELGVVRDLMRPHARLYLAYRPPAARGVEGLLARAQRNLEQAELRVLRTCIDAPMHAGCTIAGFGSRRAARRGRTEGGTLRHAS